MDIRRLIGTGLYAIALLVNIRWLVEHIASAGAEVRKHREEDRDYTRYSSYYGYYLRAVVLGTNIGAILCMLIRLFTEF